MPSKLAMALASFGTIFLSFGSVIVVIGLLGIRYGSREAMGGAGKVALGFIVAGAVLAGASYMVSRSAKANDASRV